MRASCSGSRQGPISRRVLRSGRRVPAKQDGSCPSNSSIPPSPLCIQSGGIGQGFLGVRVDLPPGQVAPKSGPGVPLASVLPGSPAAIAGLLPGDRLVGFDGAPVLSWDELTQRVAAVRPGQTVRVDFIRAGKGATLNVRIEDRAHSIWRQKAASDDERPREIAAPPDRGSAPAARTSPPPAELRPTSPTSPPWPPAWTWIAPGGSFGSTMTREIPVHLGERSYRILVAPPACWEGIDLPELTGRGKTAVHGHR